MELVYLLVGARLVMTSRWRTQPSSSPSSTMDNPSRQPRLRPQIYVRLEFGVSWSPRHAPNNHEITYKSSRRIRERSPYFPRTVPAANTNFLAAPAVQHTRQQEWDQTNQYRRAHEPQLHIQHSREVRWREPPEENPRRSRHESISSHERRRSAPPPIGDNPWDVSVPQPQQTAGFPPSSTADAAAAAMANRPAPELWKDLPEVPTRFRLGEDGMPWTPWSWPNGPDPVAYPQDEESSTHSRAAPVSGADVDVSVYSPDELYSASPMAASLASPRPVSMASPSPMTATVTSPPTFMPDDGHHSEGSERVSQPGLVSHPERVPHLGALSAAMMTVDNGFENQWWYQGSRQPIPAVDPGPAPTSAPRAAPTTSHNRLSLGWAVASPPVRESPQLSFSLDDIVSPVSDYPSTTSPPHFCALERTLSTRSEELFLYQ